jgi:hypothetical protein
MQRPYIIYNPYNFTITIAGVELERARARERDAPALDQSACQQPCHCSRRRRLRVLTRNVMGELYFRMGRYDAAVKMLTKAASNPSHGTAFDAAVSRENLAQVYQHKGNMALAKKTRISSPNSAVCGNLEVCMCNVCWASSSHYHVQCPKPHVKLSSLEACSGCKVSRAYRGNCSS